jgi:hypothetical protein
MLQLRMFVSGRQTRHFALLLRQNYFRRELSTSAATEVTTPQKYGFLPSENRVRLHPKVRDLYKRLLFAGKDYPQGLGYVRSKAKPWILQNASLTDETEIKKKVATGRFYVRELFAVINLKKYRTIKKRYQTSAE